MVVNLGDKPLAGFSEPIEMLKDCHRRIEHFLGVLRKVEHLYGERELEEDGRRALRAAIDYFASFAPRHTADEEQSLFPRMRRSDAPDAREALAELDRLENDHRRCEVCHSLVDRVVHDWLKTGRLGDMQRDSLRAALDELTIMYAAHIHLEEQRVFAIARRILSSEEIREIGEEMKERRSTTS